MQPAEELSTLVHEIAHKMLHRGERRTTTTKQVRETEAEAVAFVVCQSVGLQNGTASQDYIQLWHGDANLLRESLEAVQQTAAVILGDIAPARPFTLVVAPTICAVHHEPTTHEIEGEEKMPDRRKLSLTRVSLNNTREAATTIFRSP
jgi:hypothetical protein